MDPDGVNPQRLVDALSDLQAEVEMDTGKARSTIGHTKKLLDKHLSIIVDTQTLKSGGLPGPKGPDGRKGFPGYQGPVGAEGDRGPDGDLGPVGPHGYPGPEGLRGKTGVVGPEGDRGVVGLVGPQGFTGPPGPRGQLGTPGARGPRGPRGAEGYKGLRGSQVCFSRMYISFSTFVDVDKPCQSPMFVGFGAAAYWIETSVYRNRKLQYAPCNRTCRVRMYNIHIIFMYIYALHNTHYIHVCVCMCVCVSIYPYVSV